MKSARCRGSGVWDCLLQGDRQIPGLIVQSKSGRQVIESKVYVDASGDAAGTAAALAAHDSGAVRALDVQALQRTLREQDVVLSTG